MKVLYAIIGAGAVICGILYHVNIIEPSSVSCGCYAIGFGFMALVQVLEED